MGLYKKQDLQNYRKLYWQINKQLLDHLPALLTTTLGLPVDKSSQCWHYGKRLNLIVIMEGIRKGQFYDFTTGQWGDALQLVINHTGSRGRELKKWFNAYSGTKQLRDLIDDANFLTTADQ